MKRLKVLLKLLLYLFPLALLVVVNVVGDAGCYFHDVSNDIGKAIINGHNARSTSGNESERKIKKYILDNINEVDCVSIGPSLVTYIGKDNINCKSYYNLGVTNGDYYDMMAQFAFIDINNIKINKVIFCSDLSYFTNDSYVRNNNLHDEFMEYSNYMIDYLKVGIKKEIKNNINIKYLLGSPLFSISYFQNSFEYLEKNLANLKRIELVKNDSEMLYYQSDGSRYPSKEMREATKDDVKKSAAEYDKTLITDITFNEECIHNFILLIDYLKKQNIEITIWKCPLSPALWNEINNNYYNYYTDLESLLDKIAKEKSLKICGSYNPYKIGISNNDFYDARHIKKSSISNYFYFD